MKTSFSFVPAGRALRCRRGYLLAAFALTFAAGVPVRADDGWATSVGEDFASGKYGHTSSTQTATTQLGVKYAFDAYALKLSLPYVVTRGPADVVGTGSDRFVLGTGKTSSRQVAGWGDLVLGGTYTVLERDGWLVDLGAKVKFATGDESKGLSTGENDYAAQVEVYRSLGNGYTVFGTLGGKKMGDPAGTDLRNPGYVSLGWSLRYSPNVSLGAMYDYRQKVSDHGSPISEATMFAMNRLNAEWKLQSYIVKGFSDGSPDFGAGMVLIRAY